MPLDYSHTDTLISETVRFDTSPYQIYQARLPTDEEEMPKLKIDYAKNYIYDFAQQMSEQKSIRVDVFFDDYYGNGVKLIIDLNASEALELWLNLVNDPTIKEYQVPIAIEWLGKNDVPRHELVDYFVKIMLASGMGPRALPDFNAVTAVQETRSE